VDFNVVWRYFAWTNQTLAVFTLWAGTVWLYRSAKNGGYRWGYLMAMIPALFMTMVCSSYILIAPEGLNMPADWRWVGYVVAGVVTLSCLIGFIVWSKKQTKA
jgi:carbon starvation protein CstA